MPGGKQNRKGLLYYPMIQRGIGFTQWRTAPIGKKSRPVAALH
jgi:hypothetical protein